jgi:hypothetical protein
VQQPARRVPTPRVARNIATEPPDARVRTAKSRSLDDQQRQESNHRRELVTVWLHELARRDMSALADRAREAPGTPRTAGVTGVPAPNRRDTLPQVRPVHRRRGVAPEPSFFFSTLAPIRGEEGQKDSTGDGAGWNSERI